jgi:hypothetical protein
MKRLILPVLLTVGLLFSISGYGQQAIKVDQNFNLQLNESILQQKFVQLDFTSLQFKDEVVAQKFFKSIENNLVSFTVDYASNTAMMVIYPERLGKFSWSLEEWNTFIANMSPSCSANYASFLNQ